MEPYTHPWLVGSLQAPQAKKFFVQVLISGRLGAPLRSARKRLSHAAAAAGQPSWSACSPPGRRRSAPRACAAPRAAPAQGHSGCGPGGRPPRPGCGSHHRSGCGPAQGGARAPEYNLKSAEKSTLTAPSISRPVQCRHCSQVVCSYFMAQHYEEKHSSTSMPQALQDEVD